VLILLVIFYSNCRILQFLSNVQCICLAAGRHTLKCVVTEVVWFLIVAFKALTFHKVV